MTSSRLAICKPGRSSFVSSRKIDLPAVTFLEIHHKHSKASKTDNDEYDGKVFCMHGRFL